MKSDQYLSKPEPAVLDFLQDLGGVSGQLADPSIQSLTSWLELADTSAMQVQRRLDRTKNLALRVTLFCIVCLATLAVVFRTPAPQVLCPFAVFLMILFSDWQRSQQDVFKFAALRLAAETIRVIQAVQGNPEQLALVLSSRRFSNHAVVSLAAKACEASRVFLASNRKQVSEDLSQSFWAVWLSEQRTYYSKAFARERSRAKQARNVFNTAFGFVGFAGVAATIWSLSTPVDINTDAFRIFMAIASAAGSCGLAYMSYIRDKKAFDQSLDYGYMSRVLRHDSLDDFESIAVNESMSEHVRWALRMAGHFERAPVTNA